MYLLKISILLLALLFTFTKPIELESSEVPGLPQSYILNIDSLNAKIKSSGWNTNLLNSYHLFLINSEKSLSENSIRNLPGGYETSFLKALLLKKEQKYNEMFDTLYNAFTGKEEYLPFFEEMVFSAYAVNRSALIEERIEKGNEILYKEFISGLMHMSNGENDKAVNSFELSLKKDKINKDIYYQFSYAYRNNGDYEKAGETLRKASDLFADDIWFITRLLLAEGSLYFLSGDYEKAAKIYKKSLELSLKYSDKQNEAKAYINLGIIEDISGNIINSREYFNKAISITSSIGDFENLAIAYSELGVSYTFTNNLVEAKNKYLESLDLFEKQNNRSRLSLLLNNLGKIYMGLFDYKSALRYYEKGLELAGDNKRSQSLNLMGIADVNANLSNYTKAIQYYRKAQEISSGIKEISISAEINSGLGSLNFNLDRFNNAIHYYLSAKEYADKSGDPYLLADLNHKMALSYFEIDSLDISEKYFLEALSISSKNFIPYNEALICIDLAALQKKKEDFKNAIDNVNRGQKIAEEYGFDYLLARGKLIEGKIADETDNFKKAESLFKEALSISQQLNEFKLQAEANYKLSILYDENGITELAESHYLAAIKLIEDVSRPLFEESEVQISYLSAQREIYDSFALFYLNQNKFEKAFELIDKSRSRNLVQNLNNLKLQVLLQDTKKLEKIYEYEWIIHSGIYGKNETDSVNAEYTELKKNLVSGNPQIKKYLNQNKSIAISDIQNNLESNEHLISFYSTDDKTIIFLISGNDFKYFELHSGKNEMLKMIEKISPHFSRDILKTGTFYNQDLFSFNAKAANDFYKTFIEEVMKHIPEGDKIIISPSGDLVLLPFDFLVASFQAEQSSYDYSDKDYLIYHYSISYTPSAAVFVHQKMNDLENNDKILIAGSPEINNNEGFAESRGLLEESIGLPRDVALLPLKYSKEEIAQLSDLINADNVLTDNNATETEFKKHAELSKLIHLSTHSFLFNKQPVIFFSNNNDDKNDGLLEAGEIVQMQLNSDLVVLSSCNSGLGSMDVSEGIIGMTKAFFEAGTKSIVVSLWEVNDKYTSKLMTLFYKKLSEGLEKDEALRQAKIDFIKNYSPNPYFWSSFVLSGNINKININERDSAYPLIAGLLLIVALTVILFMKWKRNSLTHT
jgi:CHAT domain-containing protein/Flp pilus assembly protein TadD